MSDVLPYFRDYLIAQGLVRKPAVAGSVPPMWLEPKLGTPAPGEGNNPTEVGASLVIGAFQEPGITPQPYESFQQQDILALYVRSTTAPIAHAFDDAVRAAVIDKRNWDMAGMRIIESQLWQGMGLLVGDAQGYTYRLAFWVQRYFPGPGPN